MCNKMVLGDQSRLLKASAPADSPVSMNATKSYTSLQHNLTDASKLVDDIILKNYLYRLSDLEIIPLDESFQHLSDIRLFKINEMVYQNDEYSTYKFASVFNSVQNLNCSVFVLADSDGQKTDFYMGVRALDGKRTTKSLKDTLRNALIGQFPGVKTTDLLDDEAVAVLNNIPQKNIAAVSCVANNKDDNFIENKTFIQGLEKLALAMHGHKYTTIILAKSTPVEQLNAIKHEYETIYTNLSPFANMQLSYGSNEALNISESLSHGKSLGSSHTDSLSHQEGTSNTDSESQGHSTTSQNRLLNFCNNTFRFWRLNPNSYNENESRSRSSSKSSSVSSGTSDATNESVSENETTSKGTTTGTSQNMQLNLQNKSLLNTLERIDAQLKRISECESMGMWECAAYFLSDSQETAEMAAGTYKALMRGTESGVEASAINFWGHRSKKSKLPILRTYITNFIHPVFKYDLDALSSSVTAASMISGNELAIQMGLPRKSVCGFPVIEHADFGKEVVHYESGSSVRDFNIGKVFSMGEETGTDVRIDADSLTMHTFITGSTGSGKSNTVYEILNTLRIKYKIPFLVVEPAKGEYKNIFGQFSDVSVYGTNPKKYPLLRINPFSFPADVHILEHLDRLVELFNVCWPMYAAMPAILKEAMEQAYVSVGWNLAASENSRGNKYPTFVDVLDQIEKVINASKYSADSKGDYSGALLTRVRSLTTGLNRMVFTSDDLSYSELFDKSVIVDLSRVGSSETKSLIMGLLVMKLNEYRMSSGSMNSSLKHITVLEEAHNLLKRTSTEQSSESSNLLGKSVEMLANSIAEMRTYGEGFIIADQAPGLMDMSVIRNTNTKIILRLPDQSDRELVGYAAGLRKEQIDELSKLKRGVAAVYQNDWVEPVLVKVDKCSIDESLYSYEGNLAAVDELGTRRQLINFLLQGRVEEKLDFDVDAIEKQLACLSLSSLRSDYILEQIRQYKDGGEPSAWLDNEFGRISSLIVEFTDARSYVDACVKCSLNMEELTDKLQLFARNSLPESSAEFKIALIQCLMKDMSMQPNEIKIRDGIYRQWFEFMDNNRRPVI